MENYQNIQQQTSTLEGFKQFVTNRRDIDGDVMKLYQANHPDDAHKTFAQLLGQQIEELKVQRFCQKRDRWPFSTLLKYLRILV